MMLHEATSLIGCSSLIVKREFKKHSWIEFKSIVWDER